MTNLLLHPPSSIGISYSRPPERTIQHPDMFVLTEVHQAAGWFDGRGRRGSGSSIQLLNSHI